MLVQSLTSWLLFQARRLSVKSEENSNVSPKAPSLLNLSLVTPLSNNPNPLATPSGTSGLTPHPSSLFPLPSKIVSKVQKENLSEMRAH